MNKQIWLGVDVGSVSTNLVVLDGAGQLMQKIYIRTNGDPIGSVQRALDELRHREIETVSGLGITGSGRQLIAAAVGADLVKNEITAHAVAAAHFYPDVQTIMEIGGQDSKLILMRQGVAVDFAMNTVCAAGTGSFLDQQAGRLKLPVERLGELALQATNPVRIAGRCSVFAESDMIHKQQMGHSLPDIVAGLCLALVRNFLNNLGKGKELLPPFVFQGGVAANIGIRRAFEEVLGAEVIVPEHYGVMGAVGAALLAREEMQRNSRPTAFRGFGLANREIHCESLECTYCPNHCEVVFLQLDGQTIAGWGDRCGRWQGAKKDLRVG
ncbi:MAG TPA: 2-hydroxyglutaryl-CoA dehydratase [Firmicutes bacterium]|nr:2-hydroxyglutaryl-CoA dehydratase [Bacillota bacterium]